MAAAVTQLQVVDTDRDWKARIRAHGPLSLARQLDPDLRDDRWGPCVCCGGVRSKSDPRGVVYQFRSDRDGTLLWRCRACNEKGDAVAMLVLTAIKRPATTSEEWGEVRRWAAARGLVAPDPRDLARGPVAHAPLREASRPVEPPPPEVRLPPLPAGEAAALWERCVRLDAGPLPVTRAPAVHPDVGLVLEFVAAVARVSVDDARRRAMDLVRALPGGGPWPAWLPAAMTTDRRLVVPVWSEAGTLAGVRLIWTRPPAPRTVDWTAAGQPSPLESALVAAAAGLRVVDLWGIVDGRCECQRGSECRVPGKHPRRRGWADAGTVDLDVLAGWWQRHPRANVGIVTGGGLLVLDVDGAAGEASLAALEAAHGPLPVSLQARSGRPDGGRHIYLAADGWAVPTTRAGDRVRWPQGDRLGAGLDVRADGGNGLVVAPGSLHRTGSVYAVCVDAPIVPAPAWLVDAAGGQRTTHADPPGYVVSGVTANGAGQAWLRGARVDRVVVCDDAAWLPASVRWPDRAVVGVRRPMDWTRGLAARAAGLRVVAVDSSGNGRRPVRERVEYLGGVR